ncbi:hypothetical protein [Isoptericola dokdonensis]|jgi:hypothetical protein|uniref:Uncharacterized protein n=1 Tax=Isoptericola dokdonensis DS-3 TaxID=1300344 RepID=A0A161HY08_9MICO|nr:hypothetical protein [Isoptericola dokdonensis]ANC31233.1 hypothetical protein I598_1684 [Isoptericola dokdonensis DS-3]
MSFPADPPWPSQTVTALFLIVVVVFFGWFCLMGGARVPAVRAVLSEAVSDFTERVFRAGVGWAMFSAAGAFVVVQLATDALRETAQDGFDVWWAAGRPEEFPVPPDQGIGVLGWMGLVIVMAAVVWGIAYVLHGFQRYGSGKRAVQVGVLRLGLVSLVVLAYGGVLRWEVGRQQQAWADWIAVFPG